MAYRGLWAGVIGAALGAMLSGCAASPAMEVAAAPIAATMPDLPRAGPAASLPASTRLTRLIVASCNRQDNSQAYWPVLAARDPQLFLMIGDNVYGDPGWDGGADLGTFRAAYARLGAEPGFTAFRARVPMLTTWDDHDFGPNDGGGSFTYKEFSEEIFETFWDAPAEARRHPGVYHAMTYGPVWQRVQVIMLDTRFFRSDLAQVPEDQREGRLGRFMPSADPAATMLGDAQWQWLQAQLAQPADLRIVVSSIQVLTEAHHFESWSNFPAERQRLLALLGTRAPSGLVLLSGDRHSAALYSAALPNGETVWELTASSLNAPSSAADPSAREPDPLRRGPMFGEANFGMVEIDWNARRVALAVEGVAGAQLVREDVGF